MTLNGIIQLLQSADKPSLFKYLIIWYYFDSSERFAMIRNELNSLCCQGIVQCSLFIWLINWISRPSKNLNKYLREHWKMNVWQAPMANLLTSLPSCRAAFAQPIFKTLEYICDWAKFLHKILYRLQNYSRHAKGKVICTILSLFWLL